MFIDFVIAYILVKIQEGRSGRSLHAGKAGIIYSLMNTSAWVLLAALNLIIIPVIADRQDWSLFRGGLAAALSGGLLFLVAFLLRSRAIRETVGAERYVKIYAGLNSFLTTLVVVVMFGALAFILLEMSARDISFDWIEEPLKIYLTVLVTTGGFAAVNWTLFLRSADG